MAKTIDDFKGSYFFLSNFYTKKLVWRGEDYNGAEYAYQANKASNKEDARQIINAYTPTEAKKLGRRVNMRPHFEEQKDQTMLSIVRAKFSDPSLGQLLLATGKAELIEGNWWNDTYWGVYKGKGKNRLGKILMQVRKELRKLDRKRLYYAGIGSRATPKDIRNVMNLMAGKLEQESWWLRTGGADGADLAFMAGCTAQNIFLPWPGFNDQEGLAIRGSSLEPKAFRIAAHHHPGWRNCSLAARTLHARNALIVLGSSLSKKTASKAVIFWAEEDRKGNVEGGTGMGVRIAMAYGIPTFNLKNTPPKKVLKKMLKLGETG